MAYTINKTDGSIFATVEDGDANETSGTVTITGRNYSGYGEIVGENFVHLLENSADISGPTAPITGQLWFDSLNGLLKVYSGSTYKIVSGAEPSVDEPQVPVRGDFWFDINTEQLKVHNGTAFAIIGPLAPLSAGTTGPVVTTISDGTTDYIVVENWVNDELVGITSNVAEFTPNPVIAGFASIKPGYNLSTSVTGGTPEFNGTASNATLFNNINSDGFLSATSNDSTTGSLGVLNDGGLVVGSTVTARLVVETNDIAIRSDNTNSDLILGVNNGTPTDVITIDSTSARARVATPLLGTDIANMDYVNTTVIGGAVAIDGTSTMTGSLDLGTNRIINLADATLTGDAVSQSYGDTRYIEREPTGVSSVNTLGGTTTRFYNDHSDQSSATGGKNALEIFQPQAGSDAFQTFHVGNDYAVYFGLDGFANDLFVGGYSMGNVKNKIWHAGNDGPGSTLDADTLDGLHGSSYSRITIGNRNQIYTDYFNNYNSLTARARAATLSYTGVPAGATHVLLRFEMRSATLQNDAQDMRYFYATLNGLVVAGLGANDTDQNTWHDARATVEIWVPKSNTSFVWYFRAYENNWITVSTVGYQE